MAEKRPQYPVRLAFDPSAPEGVRAIVDGPVRNVMPAPGPNNVQRAAGAQIRQGARNAVLAGGAVGGLPALVAPAARALGSQDGRIAIRDFFEGLLGIGGARAAAPKAAKAAPARPNTPIEDLPNMRRTVAPQKALSAQELAERHVAAQFQRPLTMREAVAYGGMVPQVTPAPAKAPTRKDLISERAATLSEQIYADQVAAAQALAAQDEAAGRTAVSTAQAELYNRLSGLAGDNPVDQAMALLLNQNGGQ